MAVKSRPPTASASIQPVVIWAVVLFALTLLELLPLFGYHLDLSRLGSSPQPLAIVGILLTAWSPTVAALLVAGFLWGAEGVRAVLRQARRWRAAVGWYVLALGGPLVLLLLADLVYVALGGTAPKQWLALPTGGTLGFAIGSIIVGSLGEEFGWRGFAQPRLQSRYTALTASVIIGILWGTWHNWPAIVPGGFNLLTPSDVVQTYVRLIATAVIYAWMYNSTQGSLGLVMVAHAGHNIASNLVHVPDSATHTVPIIIALLYLVAALAVVRIAGARTLAGGARMPSLRAS